MGGSVSSQCVSHIYGILKSQTLKKKKGNGGPQGLGAWGQDGFEGTDLRGGGVSPGDLITVRECITLTRVRLKLTQRHVPGTLTFFKSI